jgi:hypothetical protein
MLARQGSGGRGLDQQTRIRINLSQREFEVEGSEAFVRSYAERIEELLAAIDAEAPMDSPDPPGASRPAEANPTFGSFGEFILRLPSSSTDVDKMLAAGFYMQSTSVDDAFGTSDANKRLLEQGIKLGNPSQCVKQSLLAKRVFQVSKGRYRVSQPGRGHLRQLLGPVVPE